MNWGLCLILSLLLSPLDYVFAGTGANVWLLTGPTTLAFHLFLVHFLTTQHTCLSLSHPIIAYLHDVSVVIPSTI
jgi:hypothetical protein